MDWELIKQMLTTTGPMGLLAYGMFLHHSKVQTAHADRLAEVMGGVRDDRTLLIAVVRDNTAALTALKGTIEADHGYLHQRASDKP